MFDVDIPPLHIWAPLGTDADDIGDTADAFIVVNPMHHWHSQDRWVWPEPSGPSPPMASLGL